MFACVDHLIIESAPIVFLSIQPTACRALVEWNVLELCFVCFCFFVDFYSVDLF